MTATQKQIDHYKRLYAQFDNEKIALYKKTKANLPPVTEFSNLTIKRASSVLTMVKEFLNLRNNVTIFQNNAAKNISNIYIRKEWVVDWNYKTNSILVDVPDYENGLILRFDLPKGNREKADGNFTGQLIYTLDNLKHKNHILKRDHIMKCGVYSTWTCWTRKFGDGIELAKKKQIMYVDLFDAISISNQLEEDKLENDYINFVTKIDKIDEKVESLKNNNKIKSDLAQAKVNLENNKKAKISRLLEKEKLEEVSEAKPYVAPDPPPKNNKIKSSNLQKEEVTEFINFELDEFF